MSGSVQAVEPVTTANAQALSQRATRDIREAILDGRLLPGERLVERDLAATLQVSRVPVREALRQLAGEGLVSITPNRVAIVSQVSAALVVDVFAVRMALEGLAGSIAARCISEQSLAQLGVIVAEMEAIGRQPYGRKLVEQDLTFHRLLTGLCDRPVLLAALDAVWGKTALLICASRSAYPVEQIGALHRPILEALATRNPDRVEEAIRDHLAFGETTLLGPLSAHDHSPSAAEASWRRPPFRMFERIVS